jgi:hypothetical protein
MIQQVSLVFCFAAGGHRSVKLTAFMISEERGLPAAASMGVRYLGVFIERRRSKIKRLITSRSD